MDERDLIREAKNLVDRFFSEWISLFSEYEKSIGKDLEEMEKESKFEPNACDEDGNLIQYGYYVSEKDIIKNEEK